MLARMQARVLLARVTQEEEQQGLRVHLSPCITAAAAAAVAVTGHRRLIMLIHEPRESTLGLLNALSQAKLSLSCSSKRATCSCRFKKKREMMTRSGAKSRGR